MSNTPSLNVVPLCNDREWEQAKTIMFQPSINRVAMRNLQLEQFVAKVRARKGVK